MLNLPFLLWRERALRAKRAEDWERSAQYYAKAAAWQPRNAPVWVQYGNSLKEAGALAAAEAAYRTALALDVNSPDAHLQLGHALKLQGRGHAAVAAYSRALTLNPRLHEASLELIGLGHTGHIARREAAPAATDAAIVFDVTDVLHHLLHHRRPSGIQRVQLNVVSSLLRRSDPEIACFVSQIDDWVAVPSDLFLRLSDLAIADGPADDPQWREAVGALIGALWGGDPMRFSDGAALVDLGTAAGHGSYFLRLRAAKSRHGIGYYPFVHDCIPALFPEYGTPEWVRDYIERLLGIFVHADGILAASQATAGDVATLAQRLGYGIGAPKIVRFDADAAVAPDPRRLEREPYVLFVSTFEPRKNHLLAFETWRRLIERRGLRRTPPLVCVGGRAWMVEPAMALLRGDSRLRRRVRIRRGVSDGALAALYRDCLFTLYPSAYEGWGLPVTESLCHGKVPLIAAVSSLPEAGRDFAEYFENGSAADLSAKLERLIDDSGYRAGKEAAIRDGFRPRRWDAIADEIVDWALSRRPAPAAPPAAEPGRHYALSRVEETRVLPGMVAGEGYRSGDGWWAPESWGCWIKGDNAEIAFAVAGPHAASVAVGLRGLPRGDTGFTIAGGAAKTTGRLDADKERWVSLPIDPGARTVRLSLTSTGRCNLAELTDGMDVRVVRLGVTGFRLEEAPHPGPLTASGARERQSG
jgi:glycosyltransferase involved in cell wall biosynthesis